MARGAPVRNCKRPAEVALRVTSSCTWEDVLAQLRPVLDARNLQLVQQWGGGERWDGEALLRSTQLELQQLFNQTLGIKLYHRLADSRRRCQEEERPAPSVRLSESSTPDDVEQWLRRDVFPHDPAALQAALRALEAEPERPEAPDGEVLLLMGEAELAALFRSRALGRKLHLRLAEARAALEAEEGGGADEAEEAEEGQEEPEEAGGAAALRAVHDAPHAGQEGVERTRVRRKQEHPLQQQQQPQQPREPPQQQEQQVAPPPAAPAAAPAARGAPQAAAAQVQAAAAAGCLLQLEVAAAAGRAGRPAEETAPLQPSSQCGVLRKQQVGPPGQDMRPPCKQAGQSPPHAASSTAAAPARASKQPPAGEAAHAARPAGPSPLPPVDTPVPTVAASAQQPSPANAPAAAACRACRQPMPLLQSVRAAPPSPPAAVRRCVAVAPEGGTGSGGSRASQSGLRAEEGEEEEEVGEEEEVVGEEEEEDSTDGEGSINFEASSGGGSASGSDEEWSEACTSDSDSNSSSSDGGSSEGQAASDVSDGEGEGRCGALEARALLQARAVPCSQPGAPAAAAATRHGGAGAGAGAGVGAHGRGVPQAAQQGRCAADGFARRPRQPRQPRQQQQAREPGHWEVFGERLRGEWDPGAADAAAARLPAGVCWRRRAYNDAINAMLEAQPSVEQLLAAGGDSGLPARVLAFGRRVAATEEERQAMGRAARCARRQRQRALQGGQDEGRSGLQRDGEDDGSGTDGSTGSTGGAAGWDSWEEGAERARQEAALGMARSGAARPRRKLQPLPAFAERIARHLACEEPPSRVLAFLRRHFKPQLALGLAGRAEHIRAMPAGYAERPVAEVVVQLWALPRLPPHASSPLLGTFTRRLSSGSTVPTGELRSMREVWAAWSAGQIQLEGPDFGPVMHALRDMCHPARKRHRLLLTVGGRVRPVGHAAAAGVAATDAAGAGGAGGGVRELVLELRAAWEDATMSFYCSLFPFDLPAPVDLMLLLGAMDGMQATPAWRQLCRLMEGFRSTTDAALAAKGLPPGLTGDVGSLSLEQFGALLEHVQDRQVERPPELLRLLRERLTKELRPYQQASLATMLEWERAEGGTARHLWVEVPAPTPGLTLFASPLLHAVVADFSRQCVQDYIGTGGASGILALDVGAGKTAVALALVACNPPPPSWRAAAPWREPAPGDQLAAIKRNLWHGGTLVVVPSSLIRQWQLECETWLKQGGGGGVKVVVWDGAARHLEHSIADLAAADVVLTTNGVLRTEFGQSQRESGARGAPRRLPCMRWWRIMVDEPQYCGMGNLMEEKGDDWSAQHRWCLTGTPVRDAVDDMHAAVQFLGLGELYRLKWRPREFGHVLQHSMIRYTPEGMLDGQRNLVLPGVRETDVLVELDEQDMERYRQLEQHTLKRAAAAMREVQRCERELERLRSRNRANGRPQDDGEAAGQLWCMLQQRARLAKLVAPLQSACAGHYTVPRTEDWRGCRAKGCTLGGEAKLRALGEQLKALRERRPDDKVLVFSSRRTMLAAAKEHLASPDLGIDCVAIMGGMGSARRGKTLEAFCGPGGPAVFLLTARSNSAGLHLAAACHVVLLDGCMEPLLEVQAVGRARRMGQTSEVSVTRLVAKGTVEERARQLAGQRPLGAATQLQASFLGLEGLSVPQLHWLLGAEPQAGPPPAEVPSEPAGPAAPAGGGERADAVGA